MEAVHVRLSDASPVVSAALRESMRVLLSADELDCAPLFCLTTPAENDRAVTPNVCLGVWRAARCSRLLEENMDVRPTGGGETSGLVARIRNSKNN